MSNNTSSMFPVWRFLSDRWLRVFAAIFKTAFITVLFSGCSTNPYSSFRPASMTPLSQAADEGNLEKVKELSKEDNINGIPGERTPLMHAVFENRVDVVKYLIGKGASVNQDDGITNPLSLSALRGNIECAKLLINAKADLNIRSKQGGLPGSTPLITATVYDRLDIVKLLVKSGADINAKDDYGCTAIQRAAQMNKNDIFQFLSSSGSSNTGVALAQLVGAIRNGNVKMVKDLLLENSDIDLNGSGNRPPLIEAVDGNPFMSQQASAEIISALIDKGADPNIGMGLEKKLVLEKSNQFLVEEFGVTPLMLASKHGNDTAIQMLLKRGADVDKQTKAFKVEYSKLNTFVMDSTLFRNSSSALMIAAENNRIGAIKVLIHNGANPNLLDFDGRTAAEIAKKFGYSNAASEVDNR
jgi:ankyrin repeat protein